jgi:hypothetical protein
LAVETQEPKTKVVPSSSTMVELRIAIEFAMGSSVTPPPPPTWHLVVRVLPTSPPRYAKVVNCRQRVAEIRNSMAQPTQALNKFGPQIA